MQNNQSHKISRRQFIGAAGTTALAGLMPSTFKVLAQEADNTKILLTESWRIAVAPEASQQEIFAAGELQHYIQKIIGYHLPIDKTELPQPKSFIIGRHARVKEFANRLDALHGARPDSFAVIVKSSFIGMVGVTQIATCFAVWEWLEELGVRWIFPTTKGEYVPQLKTIEMNSGENYFTPSINQRWIWPWATGDQKKPEHFGELEHGIPAWNLYQLRLRVWDSYNYVSPEDRVANVGWGHSYFRFLPAQKYFADHPEWFNLLKDQRVSTAAQGVQVCFTNEDGAREFAKNVIAEIKRISQTANFKRYCISVMPNDANAWCECENCQKLVDTNRSATSMVMNYTNLVAREVAKVYPDYILYTLAYNNYSMPPEHVKPDRNVGIHITQWTSADSFLFNNSKPGLTANGNAKFLKAYTDWSAICHNLTIYQYYGHFIWWTPWPMKTQMDFDLKHHAENPVFRGYTCEYHTNWNNQGLGRYLLAKLGWDTQQDADELQKDYCEKAFGPAAAILNEYYNVLQTAMDRVPRVGGNYWALGDVLTRGTIDRCNALMNQARTFLTQMDEGTRWRAELVIKGWEMSALMGEAMLLFRQTPGIQNIQIMRTYFQQIADFMDSDEGVYLADSTINTGQFKRYIKEFMVPLEALPTGTYQYADKMNYGGSSKFYASSSGLINTEWGYRIAPAKQGFYEIPVKCAPGCSLKSLSITVHSLGGEKNLRYSLATTSRNGTYTFENQPLTNNKVDVPVALLNCPEIRFQLQIENISDAEQYCLNGLDFTIEVV